ncbi:hypothetical protein BKA64DRAFT_720594, partial [Cadophora sp. MPI-SDFR-AT-0126]
PFESKYICWTCSPCCVAGCQNLRPITESRCTEHARRCSQEGCHNRSQNGGVCYKHGEKQKRKRCTQDGCTNQAQKGGVCKTHGAKPKPKPKLCTQDGCTNQAQKGGVCKKHTAKP